MRKKLNWRLLVACTVILILLGIGLIWILNEKEGISWHITAPIAFVIIGCILAFLQWFMPIPPATSNDSALPARKSQSEVLAVFKEDLLAAQEKGKGAIIVLATKEDMRYVFYLMDKHEVLGNRSARYRPRIIKTAMAYPPCGEGTDFYVATFGSLDPGDYLVWKSESATPPINVEDSTRRRGVGVRPDKAPTIRFPELRDAAGEV